MIFIREALIMIHHYLRTFRHNTYYLKSTILNLYHRNKIEIVEYQIN